MKSRTHFFITSLLILAVSSELSAGESVPIDVAKLKLGVQAELASEDGQHIVRIKSTPGQKPKDILFFEINELDIKENAYSLTGEVRYENVTGRSYLETWNHFVADREGKNVPVKFFTRGLNHTGPMGVLSANSDWREFQLPFFVNPNGEKMAGPTKITFNLHLEGRGTVEVRNVKLVDGLDKSSLPRALPGPMEIFVIIILYMSGPVILITLLIVLRRKKRTADELRRIRAADA